MRSHSYDVTTVWTGNTGSGTSGYRDYSRALEVSSPGRETLPGSSDPAFRGDPTRWNPELLLLAALGECHLLSYLHVCVEAGVVVTAYRDGASGTMVEDGRGGGSFREVVLRPHVTVADPSMVARAAALHADAGSRCFIAASVAFPVRHEPVVVVGAAPETGGDPAVGAEPVGSARARAEVDRIDARLVELLARRQRRLRPTTAHTGDEVAVGAPGRRADALATVRDRAAAAGLDRGVAERVWQAMTDAFADWQQREHRGGRA